MKTFRMISTGIAGALCVLLGGSPTLRAQSVILTSDRQLEELTDPDKKIDMSTGYTPVVRSLRETCEQGKSYGSKELIVAFDEFFRQYRKDAGSERRLTPDMDEYVDKIKKVSDFASGYGMGLCLSLLSPLELGPAYKAQTGHSGRWLAYKVGFRDPATGRFSLSMWQQLDWTNNKGRTPVKLTGVKAYAFKESALGNSPFRVVRPEDIVPVEDVRYEASETLGTANSSAGLDIVLGVDMRNLRVYCDKPQWPG